MFSKKQAKDEERWLGEQLIDWMGRKYLFEVDGIVRVRAQKVGGSDFDIWVQDTSKKIRDTVSTIEQNLNDLDRYSIPKIVVLKKSKLHGLAGYNYKKDILFVSDVLNSDRLFSNILADGYFAARNVRDTLVHELTHKRHWDAAKRFYKAHKKSYNTIEEAMFALNTSLHSYVKGQINCDFNYLLKISPNAEDAFRMGNVNELVADVAVLGAKNVDPALFQKVEEVCSWK